MQVTALCAFTLCSVAAAGQVVIVDGPAAGSYPDIAAAATAAFDGDLLLVGPGYYGAFTIDGKGLNVFAHDAGSVFVTSPVIVRNIPAGASVVLHGLHSGTPGPTGSDGLVVQNAQGSVRVQQCEWTGARGYFASGASRNGGDGVEVSDASRVVVVDCVLRGGRGGDGSTWNLGGSGGDGLRASNSSLAVLRAQCLGREGGTGGTGGWGGDGVRMQSGSATIVGTHIVGGQGGSVPTFAWCAGEGGNGLEASFTTLRLLDNEFVRGAQGNGGDPNCAGGNGIAFLANGAVTQLDGTARTLDLGAFAIATQPLAVSVSGEALDALSLRVSRRGAFDLAPLAYGALLVPHPPAAQVHFLGTLSTSGALQSTIVARTLGGSRRFRIDYLQLVVDAASVRYLLEPAHVAVFDPTFAPDCNGNRVPDVFDIATGASLDLDLDGKPDECP